MKNTKMLWAGLLTGAVALGLAGCRDASGQQTDITVGTQTQRGFINDNTLHSEEYGDIHYSSYIPESYDGSQPYALFITLPGWEGLYFQGVGANMVEDFGTEAINYNDQMIVLSTQLDDWGETSARQTIALTEYFLDHYNIDPDRVYLHGMSGGGETGSLVMGMRPELYAGYLATSTQWDGDLNVLAQARTPVYLAIGDQDSYYGPDSLIETYNSLHSLYEAQGMTDEEIDDILVLDVRDQEFFSQNGFTDQHAGGQAFAHDATVMGWLFEKTRADRDTAADASGTEGLQELSEVREGTQDHTLATPGDFPEGYDYGSGRITDWSYDINERRLPEPEGNATVLNTAPDLTQIQALYLWEEGNVPAQTEVSQNRNGYDPWDFRPYLTAIPVREGTPAKGAVVLLAGGAFQIRANYTDTLPTAAHLRELGYQTFIVDYRLRPYTQQEGALDVARAVRFIRQNADTYGIDPDDIAVMGYSAGGIQAGEFFLNFDEDVLPTALDPDYVPDALDEVTAHASAAGMIYSFYGRLSVASMDVESLRAGDLPPIFYCYGTEDPFYDQFEAQYDLMQEVGITTRRIVLQDWPHGFGGDGGWVEDYAAWLEQVFAQN